MCVLYAVLLTADTIGRLPAKKMANICAQVPIMRSILSGAILININQNFDYLNSFSIFASKIQKQNLL